LTFLGVTANGIEETEILRRFLRTVALENHLTHSSLHFFGFATQHRGLIGHADGFQMHIGIKAGGVRTAELIEKLLLVTAIPDVIADVISIGQREHDDVMPLAVTKCARTGGFGFFVFGLAVNDRSHTLARIFTHPLPNAHDVAARGIDDLATVILYLLQN